MHKIFTDAPQQINGRIDTPKPEVEINTYDVAMEPDRKTEINPYAHANHFELVRVIERMPTQELTNTDAA